MPISLVKSCIADDLHARGWDEREDTGQNVSCTGSVGDRGANESTLEEIRVVRMVAVGTVTESCHIRTAFVFVSLAQAHSHGRANGWGWEAAEG